ncbi:MAG TPA: apolipoprotein N-acyltransferase [Thermodesulfobacteriota bacterium]|nr:apolipoprotein N-acyltransferase [Thermodesulfobacteriota bacterium]
MRIFLPILSASLLTLSFPNFDLGFLAWVGLVPYFLAIRRKSLGVVLGFSYILGAGFFFGVFFWINSVKGVTLLHYAVLGLYLGLYFPLFGLFFHFISRNTRLPFVITAPSLWIVVEYLRSNAGFAALPMGLLGYTQHQNLSLIQMASFTGIYGVSFIIVLANAAIADLIGHWIEKTERGEPLELTRSPVLRGAVVLAVILILWVAGYTSIPSTISGKSLSLAVVQGNIPQEIKWKREYREQIISKYQALSEEASTLHPRIIVWPEASTPGFILSDHTLLRRMVSIVKRNGAYLLVGSAEYPKFGKKQVKLKSGNTALFLSPEGKILGQYLKIYLIPFGEYVPYEGIIPWPECIVPKGMNSDVAGTEPILFEVDGTKIGTLICSEILFPELGRCMVKKGAGFLVNISNEAWFGKSAYPYQALAVSVVRAVENRVNLVRCTNTGVSGFIDPYGRITARLTNGGEDLFVEGMLTREIHLSSPDTFYTRYGDMFAYACFVYSIGLLAYSGFRKLLVKKAE